MNSSLNYWLMGIGFLMTTAGAMGIHVFSRFNGGELERYCRLRRNRERFGEILDQHEQVTTSAYYVHLLGLCALLPGSAWWIAASQASSQSSDSVGWTMVGWTMVLWQVVLALLGLLLILGVSSWLPRAVARAAPASFIYYTWPLWKIIGSLISPLAAIGSLFEAVGFRLRDEKRDEHFEEELLEDEIRTKIAAGQREGLVGVGVGEMIAGVMNLDEEDVTRIMTPRSAVDALDIDLPWQDILKTVSETGRTRLPVYRETPDNIIGILYAKDLLPILSADRPKPSLSSLLRKPWFVPDTKQVDELLRDFLHNRNHIAIVLDSFHQFVGVVTIEDALEQIVGEIADELDEEVANQIRVVDNGESVDSEGIVTIDDLNKRFGWNLPESDDYDTIGGLIISRMGVIPPEATKLQVGGIQMEVTRATKRQVIRVRLKYVGKSQGVPA
jgi:putative hemolysin